MKYPTEILRNYIKDTIFECMISLKEHTLIWLHNALQNLPESLLSINEKKEILERLNKIDLSKLSKENEEEDEDEDEDKKVKIEKKFVKAFDLFEFR